MALPGEFVTMVTNVEWVFFVHRAGSATIDGQLSCVFSCIPTKDHELDSQNLQYFPVPKGYTLKWTGITDQGVGPR